MPKILAKSKVKQSGVKLPSLKKRSATAAEPVWKGPMEEGISYSLLSRYLACKERFRLYAIEGLAEEDGFSHRLEYGNLWHTCEQALAEGKDWEPSLKAYAIALAKRYKENSADVNKWYNVCRVQFPIYVEYWKQHPDVKARTNVYSEQVFQVPYKLPSGRVVKLRGKWDSVDQIGKGLYLQENKTKGEVDELKLRNQLPLDLQTMIYLTALQYAAYNSSSDARVVWDKLAKDLGQPTWKSIAGVRYNVVRRPFAESKFSIRQREGRLDKKTGQRVGAESEEEFYERLRQTISVDAVAPDGTNFFFIRFKMDVTEGDIARFRHLCLDPILENLCDDYEWWNYVAPTKTIDKWDYMYRAEVFASHRPRHFLMPYGVWNPTLEGRTSPYDEYIATGSMRGLRKVDNLFPELVG